MGGYEHEEGMRDKQQRRGGSTGTHAHFGGRVGGLMEGYENRETVKRNRQTDRNAQKMPHRLMCTGAATSKRNLCQRARGGSADAERAGGGREVAASKAGARGCRRRFRGRRETPRSCIRLTRLSGGSRWMWRTGTTVPESQDPPSSRNDHRRAARSARCG